MLTPIAWALVELDETGYAVTGVWTTTPPRWRIGASPELTARELISFAIEAAAHGSARRLSPQAGKS